MRLISASLITPLVFWACGTSDTRGTGGTRADTGAMQGPVDSGNADGGVNGFPDARANDDAAAAPDADAPDAMEPPDAGGGCTYPAGAREPMALNAVLSPYSWPTAIDPMGVTRDLSLSDVHCDVDPDYAWGRAELLLFMSAPAW